jgi:hypothetical protein
MQAPSGDSLRDAPPPLAPPSPLREGGAGAAVERNMQETPLEEDVGALLLAEEAPAGACALPRSCGAAARVTHFRAALKKTGPHAFANGAGARSLADLSDELVVGALFPLLPPCARARLAATCVRWRRVAASPELWQSLPLHLCSSAVRTAALHAGLCARAAALSLGALRELRLGGDSTAAPLIPVAPGGDGRGGAALQRALEAPGAGRALRALYAGPRYAMTLDAAAAVGRACPLLRAGEACLVVPLTQLRRAAALLPGLDRQLEIDLHARARRLPPPPGEEAEADEDAAEEAMHGGVPAESAARLTAALRATLAPRGGGRVAALAMHAKASEGVRELRCCPVEALGRALLPEHAAAAAAAAAPLRVLPLLPPPAAVLRTLSLRGLHAANSNALTEALGGCVALQVLDVSGNVFSGDVFWRAVGELPALQLLCAAGTRLAAHALVDGLAAAARQEGQPLELDVSDAFLGNAGVTALARLLHDDGAHAAGSRHGAAAAAAAATAAAAVAAAARVDTRRVALRALTLRHNRIECAGAVALAAALTRALAAAAADGSTHPPCALVRIGLADNSIRARGVAALAAALAAGAAPALVDVDLHGNMAGDEGAQALAASLHGRCACALRALRLGSNGIGAAGGAALAGALAAGAADGTLRLTQLDLHYNTALSDEGVSALAAATAGMPSEASLLGVYVWNTGASESVRVALQAAPRLRW